MSNKVKETKKYLSAMCVIDFNRFGFVYRQKDNKGYIKLYRKTRRRKSKIQTTSKQEFRK